MNQKQYLLRRWEVALMVGLAIAILAGAWLGGEQNALADKVVRLHVIANSDSAEDQALKLAVRDEILAQGGALFAQGSTADEAAEVLTANLAQLATVGSEVVGEWGYDYPVTVSLEDDVWFPTKEYEDFSLPAGEYRALRIVIGEGGGENWWCVVFPPLCLGSVSETTAQTAAMDGFDSDEISLITGESEGYIVKFKALEILDSIARTLED